MNNGIGSRSFGSSNRSISCLMTVDLPEQGIPPINIIIGNYLDSRVCLCCGELTGFSDLPAIPFVATCSSQYATQDNLTPLPLIVTP